MTLGTGMGAVEVSSLTHRYVGEKNDVLALDEVSFHLTEGQFVSIVGPSGCGKTTLLDILSGLTPYSTGTVLVGGAPPRAGRSDTARMFSRDALLPWRTALANVEFALTHRNLRADREQTGREWLQAVGLEGFEQAFPAHLSQGMRQRVALARTFSLSSQFIFLDEPFGALDVLTKVSLQDQLLALWERTGGTVVLVTHDLAEAVALSDRVLVLSPRPGRLVADVMIDLPRPRSVRHLQSDSSFHALYAQLWTELESATAGGDS